MKNTPANVQQKKYTRVPINIKKELLKQIFIQQITVKQVNHLIIQAALKLKINYSTAKTILFLYRKKLKDPHVKVETDTSSNLTQSTHKKDSNLAGIKIGISKSIPIICSIGGSQTFGAIKICGYRNRNPTDTEIHIEC